MLLKLVQSIQNSINQGGESKKSKSSGNQKDGKSEEVSQEKNKFVRARKASVKARPRSGILGQG